ncbi:TniQ protein [Acidovorax sp. 62]|nr:TniQ protein [Acidovorax sp. 62]
MHKHCEPLPIALEPYIGESGIGFLLRLASTNGINMHKLRQLVGMTEIETFTAKYADDVFALAGLAGKDQFELLPQWTRGGGACCYGHRFRVRTMLRFRRPQFCPACIRETRRCAAHWDLSVSVVCLRHQCFLQDHCPTCRKQIRWNRPSVEWGHCKHLLAGGAFQGDVPKMLLSVQRITEDLMKKQPTDFSSVGLFCQSLSLDAWGSFLWALGVIESPYAVPTPAVITKAPSSSEARSIVLRAVTRLRSCFEKGGRFSDLAPEVAAAPLVGTILDPAGDLDRTVFLNWFGAIFGEREVAALVRRHRVLSQMSLF